MRKNEHPSCSCNQCRRGKRSSAGHFFIRYINKRIRAAYRNALRDGNDIVAVRTPYLD